MGHRSQTGSQWNLKGGPSKTRFLFLLSSWLILNLHYTIADRKNGVQWLEPKITKVCLLKSCNLLRDNCCHKCVEARSAWLKYFLALIYIFFSAQWFSPQDRWVQSLKEERNAKHSFLVEVVVSSSYSFSRNYTQFGNSVVFPLGGGDCDAQACLVLIGFWLVLEILLDYCCHQPDANMLFNFVFADKLDV
jgi:hypothetical protein